MWLQLADSWDRQYYVGTIRLFDEESVHDSRLVKAVETCSLETSKQYVRSYLIEESAARCPRRADAIVDTCVPYW